MLGKEPGQVRDDNGLNMKLVWCPPGYFKMENIEVIAESASDEKAADKADEKDDKTNDDEDVDKPKNDPGPRPRVTTKTTPVKVAVTQGYWLGKYEVTQSEWRQAMATEPWQGQKLTKEGDDFPATQVS